MKKLFLGAVLTFALSANLHAADEKKEAAITLAQDMITHYNANGLKNSCDDFTNKSAGYIRQDGSLYGVMIDLEGRILCHPVNPKLNDKVLINAKDPNGVKIVQEEIRISKAGGDDWFEYMWPHPVTKKIAAKVGYVLNASDGNFVVVGYYK